MSTINDSDLLLVERNGNLHQITYDQMSTLNDDDILLVERGGVQYKVEAQYVSTGANGLIIPPVEVLTPINGAGITEFDQYEPLSSAITAVGEAGAIAKDTDEIQSVTTLITPVEVYYMTSQPSNLADVLANGVKYVDGQAMASGSKIVFVRTGTGTGQVFSSNGTVGFTMYPSDGGGFFAANGTYLAGGGSYGSNEYTTFNYDVDAPSTSNIYRVPTHADVAYTVLNMSSGNGPILNAAAITTLNTLSFPTNTNFSGLSVGDVVQSEYATLNPDDKHSGINLTNGNLTNVGTTTNVLCRATKSFSSGKWYYEATLETHGGNPIFGWADANHNLSYLGNDGVNKGYGYAAGGGLFYSLGGVYSYGVNFSAGTVLGVALDLDAGTIEYFVNGNSQGVAFNNVSGELYPAFSSGANSTVHFNFGATPFVHTPPSGYSGVIDEITITTIDASAPSQTDVYATFDPDSFNANQGTMSNGNLTLNASGAYYIEGRSTLEVFSGDNYSELTVTSASGSDSFAFGIGDADAWMISGVGSYFIYRENGAIISYPGNTTVATVASYTQGDVLGMAVDSTNVKFYKNGALQGTYAHGKSGTFYVYAMNVPNTGSAQLDINFGATAFAHTPPSGYAGLFETVPTYPNVTVNGGNWDTSNQSEVWSSNITGTIRNPEKAFNGVIGDDPEIATAHGGEEFTINFNTPISGALEIRGGDYGAGGSTAVATCSDGTVFPIGSAAWPNFQWFGPENVSNVTSIAFTQPNGGGISLSAIRLDGKLLVDTIEDSQIWSAGLTTPSNAFNGGQPATDAFDGELATFAGAGSVGEDMVFQPTTPVSYSDSVEVYTAQAGQMILNSDSPVATTDATGWVTLVSGSSGSINTITIDPNSNRRATLHAIRVDGKLLIDSGVRDFGDKKLTSSIPYEKSLTFTDTTELANMVGPLEMTDANGDVVTPVSDTIANVSGNVLTLQGDTNLAYFQPGDEVQTGVQVVSVDAAAPSITVDGGSWYGADGTGGTYEISKSLRFNSADSSYMHWTPSSAGNQKTWTWSGWVKRVNFNEECVLFSGSASPGANYYITFSGGTGTGTGPDGLSFFYGYGIHVGTAANTFRDPNAWYHVVVAVDTTQSTPAERVKIYVNGTEVTYSYTNYPSQDADLGINSSYRMSMGAINSYAAWSLSDMYLADVHFIDGQAIAPTAFGEVDSNNVWQPKEASIPSPNNGTTWSSYNAVTGTTGSTDMTNAFDGDLSTFTSLGSGDGTTTATAVFTPPSPITVNTGVRVYIGVDRGQTISVNGSQTNASVSAGWNNVSFTGTLTSLSIGPTNAGSSSNIAAIEIDGVVLVDGATAYGTNGFHLDFSDSSSDAALGANANDYATTAGAVTTSYSDFYAGANYPPKNLFDGVATNASIVYGGYSNADGVTGDSDIIWTPNGAYSVSSTLRVFAGYYSNISVNGVSLATGGPNSAESWINLNHTGPITSIKFENTSNDNAVRAAAIEIDGKILTSAVWTVNNLSAPPSKTGPYALNFVSSNGFNASYPATNAFDGSTSTYAQATATGGNLTFTPSTPIAYSSSIKINMPSAGATASVNGGSAVSVANSSETTIATGSGTLTSLVLTASNLPGLLYIKIDDEILVNSGLDSGTDNLVDSPTSNYCTWNPVHRTGATLINGNLEATLVGNGAGKESVRGTLAVSSGKYYWENIFTATSNTAGSYGVVSASTGSNIRLDATSGTNAVIYMAWNGSKAINGVATSYGTSYGVGDIIGVALDLDGGTITFYKNGISQGSITLPVTGIDYTPTFAFEAASGNAATATNFGQRPFVYDAPSGYKALTTANLPEPTIKDGSKHFDVVKYEGNSSTNVISGLGFSPDLVWIKGLNGYSHCLFDTVRGAGKRIATDGPWAEDDYNLLNSFNSDGFTLGTTAGGGAYVQNTTGYDAVAWAWNAGDTTETIAAGSLTSSVYDQSQTWSSTPIFVNNGYSEYSGRPITNLFDATTTNFAMPALGGTWRLDFGNNFASASTVQIYLYEGGTSPTLKINDTLQSYQGVNEQLYTIDVTGSGLSSIEWSYTGGTHSTNLYYIKVDGKMLIDPGVTVSAVPSVSSEVRANPAAGFSVVSWTGTATAGSVAHGLNSNPGMILLKNYGESADWRVWHKDLSNTATDYLELNKTSATQSSSAIWNNTDPTSSVFHVATDGHSNSNGKGIVAYCFAPVEGYSAMGSYTGNGSADGPFIYTGFKPRWLILKRIDTGSGGDNWFVCDTERNPNNPVDKFLRANLNYAESTLVFYDFLSNGFKIRISDAALNDPSGTYIYMAFAENPVNTPPEVDTSGDTQVSLDPLAAIATEIVETDGTTMYLNGATGPWRTGLSIEGSSITAATPGPSEITFTSQNQGTPAFSGVDATLASRTWTLESGTTATGPWTLVDTYSDFGVLNTQTGATPWTENKPTLQPNTYYRIKVQYNSTNAESVESVYNTFKTGDA